MFAYLTKGTKRTTAITATKTRTITTTATKRTMGTKEYLSICTTDSVSNN